MQIDLNKEIPETFQPLLLDQSRFLILKGSAGAGKSVFVTKKMVFRCLHESMHRFLMLRKVRNTVRESLYEETKKRIYEWKLRNRVYYQENKSELKIWLKDSQFIFNGLDDPERIKSITGITGIVLEEMTEFKEDDFDQVNLRLRGKMPYYKQTIGMFNPIEETHWIKGRFFDNPSKSLDITTHESTYKDNHFLDKEYIQLLESYKETNDMYYQVYCLGNWGVVDKTNKFLFNFEDHHIASCSLIPDKPVKISFDFNLEPFAAIVYQTDKNNMWVFDKVRLNNSDIHQVCDYIKSNYGQYTLIVTGDRSGYNRSGVVRGKTSYWQEIKRNLNLAQFQIKLRTKNLDLVSSRILCNSALKHKQIIIDPSLKELINDCKYAQVDDKGELIKDRNKNQNDFMDCLTGDTNIICENGVKKIKNISLNDKVLTRNGYKKVIDKWHSYKEVWEYKLTNGTIIKSTKNHYFYGCNYGFLPIHIIFENKINLLCKSNIKAEFTGNTQNKNIYTTIKNLKENILPYFIDKYGLIIMEKYQKICKFIIKMVMRIITLLITWNLLKDQSMQDFMQILECKIRSLKKDSRLQEEKVLKYGMAQKKEKNGIKNIIKTHWQRLLESLKENAGIAQKLTFQKNQEKQNFAPTYVNLHGEEKTGLMILEKNVNFVKKNLSVTSIQKQKHALEAVQIITAKKIGIRKVYDITVEKEHEFFANGILTHNCLRYAIDAEWPEILKRY